ncbi:MAG: hypothetical protein NZ455_02765 [Bacteroidia bacterium]|nr:hypothetical protein [Bacteroidia bacterium]
MGRSTVSPQLADLACMSAAKRKQGHAQKISLPYITIYYFQNF